MCGTKAAKPQPIEKQKKVQFLSNPWVDGLGIVGSGTRGRNSLRNDTPRAPVTTAPPPGTPSNPSGPLTGGPTPPAVLPQIPGIGISTGTPSAPARPLSGPRIQLR